jgi:hypothetical protein
VLSRQDDRIYFPFGEKSAADTGGLSLSIIVFRHCPDDVSHIRLLISNHDAEIH